MIIAEEVDSLNDTPSNCDEEFLDSLEPAAFSKKCRVTVDVNVGIFKNFSYKIRFFYRIMPW